MPPVAFEPLPDPLDTKVVEVAEAVETGLETPPAPVAPLVAEAPTDAPLATIVVAWYIVVFASIISVNQDEYEEHVNVKDSTPLLSVSNVLEHPEKDVVEAATTVGGAVIVSVLLIVSLMVELFETISW